MKPSMDDAGVAELSAFAQETIQAMGREALTFYGRDSKDRTWFNQDLVTQTELHLIDAFQKQLQAHYPNHLIYGQDALDAGYTHDAKRYLWVFDPLDGVDNFQSGIPLWGMSLALYENYWPVCGLFLMPVTHDLFRANAGSQAYWNDRPIHISNRDELSQEGLLLTFSRFHQHYQSKFPGKIRDFGSIGAHACYVAMGRADAALTARESFKDLAAVRIIVESAGGRFYTTDGRDFYLGDYIDGQRIEQHLLITDPAHAELVLDALKPIS